MNVAHTLPLTPAHAHSVLSEILVKVVYNCTFTSQERF